MGFIVRALFIWGAVHLYIGTRLILPAGLRWPYSALAWALLAVSFLLTPATFFLNRAGERGVLASAVVWIGYVAMGVVALLLPLLLVRDIGWLLVNGADIVATWARGDGAHRVLPVDADRRRLVANVLNVGLLGVTGTLAAIGFVAARRRPDIVRVKVPVPDLPDDLVGLRIAQITDIHVGPTIKGDYLARVVRTVNDLGADLIAVTGDLVDGSVDELREHVASLGDLRARDGVYFVTGNHEYYSGALEWVSELRRLGLTVLLNEHRVVEHGASRVLVAGVTDYSGGGFMREHRSDPHQAIRGAPDAHLKLLLAHQPRSIFEAAKAGFDLQLSGHTHGGQFFPWNFFVRLQQPFTRGLNRLDRTWCYVSCGTGYWGPPLRIGIPSEITLLTLERGHVRPS